MVGLGGKSWSSPRSRPALYYLLLERMGRVLVPFALLSNPWLLLAGPGKNGPPVGMWCAWDELDVLCQRVT